MKKIIIAIDGPAASGKGKIAKYISKKWKFRHLDSGLLYRNMAYIILKNGIDLDSVTEIKKIIDKCDFALFKNYRKLRTEQISKITSKIANLIRKFYLNDDCIDTGCALKLFERDVIINFPFFNGIHRFLPAIYKGLNKNCCFINVNHRYRKFGKSKYGTVSRLVFGIRDMIKVKKLIKNNK